jgi:translation initiation factor IF-2
MSNVDQRLEVATYFRQLLRQSLFSDASTAARTVERKVRVFVKEQLEILLSLRPEVAPVAVVVPQFDEAEVAALKMVAARLIKKPDLAPAVPTVKSVATPLAPRVPTVVPAVVVRRPVAPPAVAPAAPTVRPAAPAPTPAPKPARGRPRGPAKPTGKAPVLEEVRLIPHPDNPSVMVETRHQRIQRPKGALPFPSDNVAMEAAIAASAHRGASAVAQANPGHSDLARVIISAQ